MIRWSLTLVACVALTACGGKKEVAEAPAPQITPNEDCYTVVLFDDHPVLPPEPGVPPEEAAFLGKWVKGAWNGEWCHDILVTEVKKGGVVKFVDMQAPYEPFGQPATAFQRTGHFDKDGNLRVRYGTESVKYWLQNGMMRAEREGIHGTLEAMLEPSGDTPVATATLPESGAAEDAAATTQSASKDTKL